VGGDLLVGVAALVGCAVGAVGALSFRLSERAQAEADVPAAPEPVLPVGAADVLAVLRSSAVVLDAEGRVVRASPLAYSLGLVRDDHLTVAGLEQVARRSLRDGEIREAELDLPRGPVGTGTRALAARVAPLGSTLALVLVEDLTEVRQVESVRRDFVANVSHELKTPVGALSLLAEATAAAADDEAAVRRFAARMTDESARLSALVQDLLDLSRVQWDDPLRSPALVDLGDVVAESVDRARLVADAKGIEITTGGDPELLVHGDEAQLVMALSNLVDNAVRYSPDGTAVGVTCRRAEDGLAELVVTDQGIGIAEADLGRIFERFYRVDPARSRATGGTGLGLSLVKHVASSHGGEVTVWSRVGAGSTFTLRLPAAEREAP
jgi:two-component system sensor histidine kinase SenX3